MVQWVETRRLAGGGDGAVGENPLLLTSGLTIATATTSSSAATVTTITTITITATVDPSPERLVDMVQHTAHSGIHSTSWDVSA